MFPFCFTVSMNAYRKCNKFLKIKKEQLFFEFVNLFSIFTNTFLQFFMWIQESNQLKIGSHLQTFIVSSLKGKRKIKDKNERMEWYAAVLILMICYIMTACEMQDNLSEFFCDFSSSSSFFLYNGWIIFIRFRRLRGEWRCANDIRFSLAFSFQSGSQDFIKDIKQVGENDRISKISFELI